MKSLALSKKAKRYLLTSKRVASGLQSFLSTTLLKEGMTLWVLQTEEVDVMRVNISPDFVSVKCNEKFEVDDTLKIYRAYWSLSSFTIKFHARTTTDMLKKKRNEMRR
ncbi:uncharacterized protein LOC118444955 isoform X1 [Vespa mandarinia]|uniref:uncharacterized protein LOC118444955 isoform X1 n=1 Tax=Vespa mandarinia TaxID=7446 RepID=UPI00160C7C88|nr:uncharacterized protein LOC118444955 isoform X1 [Vespa mandarinia]